MHILLTNDNGFAASGLWEMAQALRVFGKVTILVPEQDWAYEGCYDEMSAMRIRLATLPDSSTVIVGHGNPSDCVTYGLTGFLSRKVDLVVSGVNEMPSAQHHLGYSAGVTAVTEGVMLGVPGIAVSMPVGFGKADWQPAIAITCQTVQELYTQGLPSQSLYNLQIPSGTIRNIRRSEQDLRVYYERLAARREPNCHFPDLINSVSMDYENPTDVLAHGYALITELKLNPIASQALTAMTLASQSQPAARPMALVG